MLASCPPAAHFSESLRSRAPLCGAEQWDNTHGSTKSCSSVRGFHFSGQTKKCTLDGELHTKQAVICVRITSGNVLNGNVGTNEKRWQGAFRPTLIGQMEQTAFTKRREWSAVGLPHSPECRNGQRSLAHRPIRLLVDVEDRPMRAIGCEPSESDAKPHGQSASIRKPAAMLEWIPRSAALSVRRCLSLPVNHTNNGVHFCPRG